MRSRSQAARNSAPAEKKQIVPPLPEDSTRRQPSDKTDAMEGRPSIASKDPFINDLAKSYANELSREGPPKSAEKLIDQTEAEQERRDAAERRANAEAPKTRDEIQQSIARLDMGTHARIVDTLFEDDYDAMAEYQSIRASLTFGGRASAMSYSQLVDALDEAHVICDRASRLLANAKVTHDAFAIDAEVVRAALRKQATEDLQAQKASGERTKAITNDDVTSVMATKFHDEYRALELTTGKARRMVAAIEQLFDRCVARAGDLRTMVAKTRES